MAKFLQMDGTLKETRDPNWDREKAENLGLIPAQNKTLSAYTSSSVVPAISKETVVSLGSLAFEGRGFSLEK